VNLSSLIETNLLDDAANLD
jgi:hypothetical protein